jgi:hypothetical protein
MALSWRWPIYEDSGTGVKKVNPCLGGKQGLTNLRR